MLAPESSLEVPADIAVVVAASLPPASLPSVRAASSFWQAACDASIRELSPSQALTSRLASRFPFACSLDLRRVPLTEEQLAPLRSFAHLASLALHISTKAHTLGQVAASVPGLQSLSLRGCTKLTWADLGLLTSLKRLKTLNVAGVKYQAAHATAPGLPAVLSRLESLVVGDTCTLSYVDDSLLVLLAKHAKRLTALDCSGCIDVTDQGVTALEPLGKNLDTLSLQSCVRLTNGAATSIASASTRLRSLNLRGCLQLTEAGVQAFSRLTNLEELCLQGCTGVKLLSGLSSCSQLHTLGLKDCTSLATLEGVTSIKGLRSLDVSGCSALTVGALPALGGLSGSLTKLVMSGWQNQAPVQDAESCDAQLAEGLSRLGGLQHLDVSDFRHPQGMPAGLLQAISSMRGLQWLNLGNVGSLSAKAQTAGLSFLSGLTQLRHLDLSNWRGIEPAQLGHISGLTALESLALTRFGNDAAFNDASCGNMQTSTSSQDLAGQLSTTLAGQGTSIPCSRSSSIMSSGTTSTISSLQSYDSNSRVGMVLADDALSQVPTDGLQCVGSNSSLQSTTSDSSDMDATVSQSSMGSLLGHMSSFCLGTQFSSCPGTELSDDAAGMQDCTMEASTSSSTNLDQALMSLQGLNLRHLKLNGCSSLTDSGARHIAYLPQLQQLDLSGCRGVTGKFLTPQPVSDDRASSMTAGSRLEVINLEDSGITQACIVAAADASRQLAAQVCSSCNSSGSQGRTSILHSLTQLNVGGCASVGDAAAEALAQCGMTRLRSLSLSGCHRLGSRGLAALAVGMRNLQSLDISRCRQVRSIACFASSPRSLSRLDISHCWLIPDAGIASIQQQRPFLRLTTSRPVLAVPAPAQFHTQTAAMSLAQQVQPQQLAAGILVQS